jgi:predicted ATPase
MIRTVAVAGYRSLRDVSIGLDRLTIITGANGSGKSGLYRALRLLTDVAHGRVIGSLAHEGGLESTVWAGPEVISAAMRRGEYPIEGAARRVKPVSLQLGIASDEYSYAIDIGFPVPGAFEATEKPTRFSRDPVIKTESLWVGEKLTHHSLIGERRGGMVRVRARDGEWNVVHAQLPAWDSMMTHAADPRDGAEFLRLRDAMRRWRFYDDLDTGRDAPARRPQVGTRTPILSGDGADLAAAVQTIRENGDADELDRAIGDAFPGSSLEVITNNGYFELSMRQPGLLRPLSMRELSDGTLRFVLLAAALLSPHPPALLVLNEPETSLHVDLLPALARLIAQASSREQVVVVSHAAPLVRALAEDTPCRRVTLSKPLGETVVDEEETPAWRWPKR